MEGRLPGIKRDKNQEWATGQGITNHEEFGIPKKIGRPENQTCL